VSSWVDLLGWCATAVFVASYFAAKPEVMRRIQMAGALLWVAYGVVLPAMPVIAANLLVVSAAAWTARRPRIGHALVQPSTSVSAKSSPTKRSGSPDSFADA
jgi:hypothetical protein